MKNCVLYYKRLLRVVLIWIANFGQMKHIEDGYDVDDNDDDSNVGYVIL